MRGLWLALALMSGCGSESDSEVKELPVYPIDMKGTGYKKIGSTGRCDAAMNLCVFHFELKERCQHGSFILYLVRSHYVYAWVIPDDEAVPGKWDYNVTAEPKLSQDILHEYRESMMTFYSCLDSQFDGVSNGS